jgi:glycine/sarcosine/betaine reductase complex component A
MDLENQARIKALVEEHGVENVVVVLGGAEAEASGLAAETVTVGDPTFAGPLAGVELGIGVYHILELKDIVDEAVWEEQISMMEMVLDVEEVIAEVKQFRDQGSKYSL